jgi:glutathione S-transferase
MLALYFAPGASSMAPHIALNEIGAPFEPRPVSLARRETREPWFLEINAAGKAPVLMIDGRPLNEVAGILFYLARTFPEAGLLPESAEGQGQAVSWMSFIASSVHPSRRGGLEEMRRVWAIAEQRLGGRTWAVEGAYSIADIHLFRLFWRFARSFGEEARAFPGLSDLHARMLARPAVQKTIATESALGYELPG